MAIIPALWSASKNAEAISAYCFQGANSCRLAEEQRVANIESESLLISVIAVLVSSSPLPVVIFLQVF